MPSTHIVIVGGGYAGLLIAGHLSRNLDSSRITLIDRHSRFSHRVRWHQYLAGQAIDNISYTRFTQQRGIDFIQASVTSIDPAVQQVHMLADGRATSLGYDQLVYALGSFSRPIWQGPSPANIYRLNNLQELDAVRQQFSPGKRLLLIGSGLTAIEYATELAESHPLLDITLVTRSTILSGYSTAAQHYARSALHKFGISLIENSEVVALDNTICHTANGVALPFDVCVCSAGFEASPVWRDSGLPVLANGQIAVDKFMSAIDIDNVWVAGDAAQRQVSGGPLLRMSCATACITSPLTAANIIHHLNAEPLYPITPFYYCHCISLGRSDAIVQLVTGDDKIMPTIVSGKQAAAVKEQIASAVMSTLMWDGQASQADWWPDFAALAQSAV